MLVTFFTAIAWALVALVSPLAEQMALAWAGPSAAAGLLAAGARDVLSITLAGG
jgi:hypothetical protein